MNQLRAALTARRRAAWPVWAAGSALALVVQLLWAVLAPAAPAFAAPGGLDPTFGSGGVVTTPSDAGATGVAVLGNGDIAVSGGSGGSASSFQVSLYGPGGNLLWTRTPFSGRALAVSTNGGDVVVAGWIPNSNCSTGQDPVVAVYDTGGTPLGIPKELGCVTYQGLSGYGGKFTGVTVDGAGNVVAAGHAAVGSGITLVARFNPSGSALDTSFGSNGYTAEVTGPAGSSASTAAAVAVSPVSGDIVVAGDSSSGASRVLTVAAFNQSGSLDTNFGASGVATYSGVTAATGVVVLPGSGNVVASGYSGSGPLIAEFSSLGAPGYAGGTPAAGGGQFSSIAYQPDGNVLTAAGATPSDSGQQMLFEQFDASTGGLNPYFGSGGVLTVPFAGPANLAGVAAQSDGKFVGAGAVPYPTAGNVSVGLARVLGPQVSVHAPGPSQVMNYGPVGLTYQLSLDEPMFGNVYVGLCPSPDASIGGGSPGCAAVTIPAGSTTVAVTVNASITDPPGSQLLETLQSYPGGGVTPSFSQASATATVGHIQYYMVGSDGGIFAFHGDFQGSTGGLHLARPIVGMAADPATNGYYMVASDGGIFAFHAPFFGSMGGHPLSQPIVGMAVDPATGGYWMVASDGGIFAFNAPFFGSMGGHPLAQPVVGMAATPDGGGYWLVARDGGIFAFGDASFYGSMGGRPLSKPIVGIAADPATGGYWMVASDGGIFAFNAPFAGSMGGHPLAQPVVGMAPTPDGAGYWEVARDGGIFAFNAPFLGSMGGLPLSAPIVAMSS